MSSPTRHTTLLSSASHGISLVLLPGAKYGLAEQGLDGRLSIRRCKNLGVALQQYRRATGDYRAKI